MTARAIMVLGTTSGAGKSWIATALCRWYARRGLSVAPFKAQNMSNNARVVPGPGGALGEIGSAQYFQAIAAGVVPDVRMNPVLLKPEHPTGSQVVVLGAVRNDLRDIPWRQRSEALWPFAREALDDLRREHDLIIIEGAGSPAEINLHSSDYVNMRTARHAHAACLLATDIDRGGAFAHLYGTHQLLPPEERALIRGFLLNRFRGDAALLDPGPAQLQALTGVPTLGVLPLWRDHGLPEEDGLSHDTLPAVPSVRQDRLRVAIVAYPRISNLDELQPLRALPGVRLSWARHPRDLDGVDWIILPGSKHTRADLAWLRSHGIDRPILDHARQGGAILGLCGGLQMLGKEICDPLGVEGPPQDATPGLGLLDLSTTFLPHKHLAHTRATFTQVAGSWHCLSTVVAQGYEIRHGRSHGAAPPALLDPEGQAIGWSSGSILGLYLHGLFEDAAVIHALFGHHARSLPQVMEGLADLVDQHISEQHLLDLLQ